MATNEEILAAHMRKEELTASKRKLERAIKDAKKKLETVDAELYLARSVDEVIEGLAVEVSADTPVIFDMQTLARGPGIVPRNVHAYRIATGTTWAVRVNGGECDRPLFNGGKVVGIGRGWSRADALEVAKRWLTGDESVLAE